MKDAPKEFVKFITEGGRVWDFPNPNTKQKVWEMYYLSHWPEPEEVLCPVCGMEFTDERKFERHIDRCYKIQEKARKHNREQNEIMFSSFNWKGKND